MKNVTVHEQIVEIANLAIYLYWQRTDDVSEATLKAQLVAKHWQNWVKAHLPEVWPETEARLSEDLNERIDLIAHNERTAYEFKVSPNNVDFEFYKNVFKILHYNFRNPDKRVKKFIFMCPGSRTPRMLEGIGEEVVRTAAANELEIEIVQLKKFA